MTYNVSDNSSSLPVQGGVETQSPTQSVEEMNFSFSPIRESVRLASFKPNPFCHCSGHFSLVSILYSTSWLFFLQHWTFTAWQKIPGSLESTDVLFFASKIEVCWGRRWVEAANSWDCMSSSSDPTGHVVSCRLEGGKMGKKWLFLEAAQCTEGERKKIVL